MSNLENQYDNLVSAIEDLKKRGFTAAFRFEDDKLNSLGSGASYNPDQIKIEEFHRFEGATDFEDMSILYGIETSSGEKGVIVDAFGTYANRRLGEFLKKARMA